MVVYISNSRKTNVQPSERCPGFWEKVTLILPKPIGFGKRKAREKLVVSPLTFLFFKPTLHSQTPLFMKPQQETRRWFISTITILVIIIGIYLLLHRGIPGSEFVRLSKQETNDVNLTLFGTNSDTPLATKSDTATGTTAPGITTPVAANDKELKSRVYSYLFSIREPYDTATKNQLIRHFDNYTIQQFSIVISNYPIKVTSYFWLTG